MEDIANKPGSAVIPAVVGTNPALVVAAIGASAGGLGATSELLRNLGKAPGIAIVVVHHLDAKHDSSLVEIFSRVAEIPVQTATDGTRLEPNRVYVMPPNADWLFEHGVLRLIPREDGSGLHLPIDRFFASLAKERTLWAVGVLLSGTGSDGSLGIKAIKGEGGVTLAQDAGAEYRSMPDSAIATECVDFVLSPKEIAEELLRIGSHLQAAEPEHSAAHEDAAFRRILAILRKTSGVDFANYKHSTLLRRVQRRVFLHRSANMQDYLELLERDPAEVTALYEEVLIHVTGFFRDPEVFEALKAQVLPKLLENRSRTSPIRVWVPGCSTGEEVYSIAMSLLEFLADSAMANLPIRLFATDVSTRAIRRSACSQVPADHRGRGLPRAATAVLHARGRCVPDTQGPSRYVRLREA